MQICLLIYYIDRVEVRRISQRLLYQTSIQCGGLRSKVFPEQLVNDDTLTTPHMLSGFGLRLYPPLAEIGPHDPRSAKVPYGKVLLIANRANILFTFQRLSLKTFFTLTIKSHFGSSSTA